MIGQHTLAYLCSHGIIISSSSEGTPQSGDLARGFVYGDDVSVYRKCQQIINLLLTYKFTIKITFNSSIPDYVLHA